MMAKDKEPKRTNGWDERDYKLWSDIQQLPSFGLIAPRDSMISLNQVVQTMKKHAEARFDKEWSKRYGKVGKG